MISLAVVVLVVLLSAAGWIWFASQQHRGMAAYAAAMTLAQTSEAPEAPAEARVRAIRELEGALQSYPSAEPAARAAYQLGNLKYSLQQYSSARSAYEIAASRSGSDTVKALARAAVGHAWEAERNYAKAVEVFEAMAASLKPDDFLYEQLLIDLARTQELAGRQDDAVKTYRRILESPRGRRADEIRTHLARRGVDVR